MATEPVSRRLLWNGAQAWLVTGYDNVKVALADSRLSTDVTRKGYPDVSSGSAVGRRTTRNFMVMDDPAHHDQRAMLAAEFTRPAAERRRDRVREIVGERLDDLPRDDDPIDLLETFAQAIPARVVCEILGVPYRDNEFVLRQLRIQMTHGVRPEDATASNHELREFLSDLIDRKTLEPSDDLISRVVRDYMVPGALSRDDLVSNLRQLLFAGQDSTVQTLALSIVVLLAHPEQLRVLRTAGQGNAWANGVEELLRVLSVTHMGRRRVAVDDLVIGGCPIRAGEGVICDENGANHDPAVFIEPDTVDTTRTNARAHLGFGFGPHFCLGAHLARVELQESLAGLFGRFPNLRLAVDENELRYRTDMVIYGLESLPATLGANGSP